MKVKKRAGEKSQKKASTVVVVMQNKKHSDKSVRSNKRNNNVETAVHRKECVKVPSYNSKHKRFKQELFNENCRLTSNKEAMCNCGKIICKAGKSKCYVCETDQKTLLAYPQLSLKIARISLMSLCLNPCDSSQTNDKKQVIKPRQSYYTRKTQQLKLKHRNNASEREKFANQPLKSINTHKKQLINSKQTNRPNLRNVKRIQTENRIRSSKSFQAIQPAEKVTTVNSNELRKSSFEKRNVVLKHSNKVLQRSKNQVNMKKKAPSIRKVKVQTWKLMKHVSFICCLCRKSFKSKVEKILHEFCHKNKEVKVILDRNEVERFLNSFIDDSICNDRSNSNLPDSVVTDISSENEPVICNANKCIESLSLYSPNISVPNGDTKITSGILKENESCMLKVVSDLILNSNVSSCGGTIDIATKSKDVDPQKADLNLLSCESSEPSTVSVNSSPTTSKTLENNIESNTLPYGDKTSISLCKQKSYFPPDNDIVVLEPNNSYNSINIEHENQEQSTSATRNNTANTTVVVEPKEKSSVEHVFGNSLNKPLNGNSNHHLTYLITPDEASSEILNKEGTICNDVAEQSGSLNTVGISETINSSKSSPDKAEALVKPCVSVALVGQTTYVNLNNKSGILPLSDPEDSKNAAESRGQVDTFCKMNDDSYKLSLKDSLESLPECHKRIEIVLNEHGETKTLEQNTVNSSEKNEVSGPLTSEVPFDESLKLSLKDSLESMPECHKKIEIELNEHGETKTLEQNTVNSSDKIEVNVPLTTEVPFDESPQVSPVEVPTPKRDEMEVDESIDVGYDEPIDVGYDEQIKIGESKEGCYDSPIAIDSEEKSNVEDVVSKDSLCSNTKVSPTSLEQKICVNKSVAIDGNYTCSEEAEKDKRIDKQTCLNDKIMDSLLDSSSDKIQNLKNNIVSNRAEVTSHDQKNIDKACELHIDDTENINVDEPIKETQLKCCAIIGESNCDITSDDISLSQISNEIKVNVSVPPKTTHSCSSENVGRTEEDISEVKTLAQENQPSEKVDLGPIVHSV